jgi:hypothetical protein
MMASLVVECIRPGSLHTTPPALGIADAGEVLGEAEVSELASRLLYSRNGAERDHLLGAILTEGSGGGLSAPLGSALGGMLKNVARQSLAGPASSGELFGWELEGLPDHERELAAAQRFVRLAADAARNASEDAELENPHLVAQSAIANAADAYAPGLGLAHFPSLQARSGRWVRVGRTIVVQGAGSPFTPTPVIEPFDYDPKMEYFLGGIVKSVGRAVTRAAKTVGRAADKAARTAGKAVQAVGNVPIVGDVARAGVGAARLSLGPAAIAFDAGLRAARGENIGKALRGAVGSHLDAARSQLKLAEMVAPFIPGVGTGVAAALGAANALAAGRPITDALVAAARSALPGGAVAQAAFDTALNLAKGKSLAEAALSAARDRLPGGPAARAAFDAAVALAKGKRLQDAAFAAAGRVLPPSPFAADALDFVKRVANGQNIQHAALSVAGQRAVREIKNNARLASREMELEMELEIDPRRPSLRVVRGQGQGSGRRDDVLEALTRAITYLEEACDPDLRIGDWRPAIQNLENIFIRLPTMRDGDYEWKRRIKNAHAWLASLKGGLERRKRGTVITFCNTIRSHLLIAHRDRREQLQRSLQ